MEAFATVDEYRMRYPDDKSGDKRLEALLIDATAQIQMELRKHGVKIVTEDELQMASLMRITCSVVHRITLSDAIGPVSQRSETGGPYTINVSPSNPNGDQFLTKQERRELGIDVVRMGVIRPSTIEYEYDQP